MARDREMDTAGARGGLTLLSLLHARTYASAYKPTCSSAKRHITLLRLFLHSHCTDIHAQRLHAKTQARAWKQHWDAQSASTISDFRKNNNCEAAEY